MSRSRSSNPFDLLGQAKAPSGVVRVAPGAAPWLEIQWGSFHGGFWSSVSVLVRNFRSKPLRTGRGTFEAIWVEGKIPRRALLAAALWHLLFLLVPFPRLPAAPRRYTAFDNAELTWSGPITEFPLLDPSEPKQKAPEKGAPREPLPPEGADAFHPRQRILARPARPNHPRQMLVNPAAPPQPPKFLPALPNIVQLQEIQGPARPALQISQEALLKLRPWTRPPAASATVPAPEAPLLDQKIADFPAALLAEQPQKPKMELHTGSVPRLEERARPGELGPAPEVASSRASPSPGSPATFIALSATPGPPAPEADRVEGNLSARISISPEGKQPGTAGGASPALPAGSGSGAPRSSPELSISGGSPPSHSVNEGSGAAPRIRPPSAGKLGKRPEQGQEPESGPVRTGPPAFSELPPGAQPEQIFASKRVYKMLVNMPNLNSATGSWVLNFSELSEEPSAAGPGEVSSPVPLRKVDPKYPPTLARERIEGEVVLYAVIRSNGTVDSIQLVRGIDEQLDANAMAAFSQWKFRPATRGGFPVDLEAIIHIPFNARRDR